MKTTTHFGCTNYPLVVLWRQLARCYKWSKASWALPQQETCKMLSFSLLCKLIISMVPLLSAKPTYRGLNRPGAIPNTLIRYSISHEILQFNQGIVWKYPSYLLLINLSKYSHQAWWAQSHGWPRWCWKLSPLVFGTVIAGSQCVNSLGIYKCM